MTISRDETRVTLDADRLHIECLTITDRALLTTAQRYLHHAGGGPGSSSEVLGRYIATALEVGIRALGVVEASLDLTALDQTVAGLSDRVTTSTDRALEQLAAAVTAATDPGTGAIPRSIETTLQGLVDQVHALVAGQDAPVRTAVTESVREVTEQTLAEVQRGVAAQADAVRRVLATDAPGSPLYELKKGLVEGLNTSHRQLAGQLHELRTALEVDKAQRAAASKSPQHGIDTETHTLAALEQLAHAAGDRLENTGTIPGVIPRCLKGDAVITLTPPPGHVGEPARVVIEVKDRDRAQSVTAWAKLLQESRENRRAVAALGIVKTIEQMPGQRRLHVLSPTAYLLAYDPTTDGHDLLQATYHLLRSQAWAATLASAPTGHAVDLAALCGSLAHLTTAIDTFDTLTRHHNAAKRSIDAAEKATNGLRADLHARVETTRKLLQPAPPATDAA